MTTKIIVEICQNHSGSRENVAKLIRAAAENGADIIKSQTIYSEDVTRRERFEDGTVDASGKQTAIKRPYQAEVDRLAKLDLTLEDEAWFIEEVKKVGAMPMTTIFARGRIPETGKLAWPKRIVKVASYDCASYPMLRELAQYFDEFIISTGATYDEEIEKTAKLMKELGKGFSFLHCVTSYPNTLEMANLKRMDWLRTMTPKVGWSDHTLVARDGIVASKIAIMLGADYVERHFTVFDGSETKDGPISINPALLKELSDFRNLSKDEQKKNIEATIPDWEKLLGSEHRDMTQVELLNRDYYRGRFATRVGDKWLNNWETEPVTIV